MNWLKYKFKTQLINDIGPQIVNPQFPWWYSRSGKNTTGEFIIIVAFLPANENIFNYWADAYDIETEEVDGNLFI